MNRRYLTKTVRQQVYDKCNGHCACLRKEVKELVKEYGVEIKD